MTLVACQTYLRFDVEGSKLLLAIALTVVAWINTNFYLGIKAGVDI